MKHFILNEELRKSIGLSDSTRVFSCEYDSGEMSKDIDRMIRLGGDGMDVWILPCISCLQQIESEVFRPLISDAVKEQVRKKGIVS